MAVVKTHRADEVRPPHGSGESRQCGCGEPFTHAAQLDGGRFLFFWCPRCDVQTGVKK